MKELKIMGKKQMFYGTKLLQVIISQHYPNVILISRVCEFIICTALFRLSNHTDKHVFISLDAKFSCKAELKSEFLPSHRFFCFFFLHMI